MNLHSHPPPRPVAGFWDYFMVSGEIQSESFVKNILMKKTGESDFHDYIFPHLQMGATTFPMVLGYI